MQWRRQASEFGGGGGHLRGKLIFWGKIEFSKRYCYLTHAVVTGLLSPPPGDSPSSQKGATFLGIPPPGDECPRNIAPPFRIFAPPHICDVVYSNNFVILSSY